MKDKNWQDTLVRCMSALSFIGAFVILAYEKDLTAMIWVLIAFLWYRSYIQMDERREYWQDEYIDLLAKYRALLNGQESAKEVKKGEA